MTATLAQIVAALSVTYKDSGVLIWLNGHGDHIADGRMDDVADAVRLIGDADPDSFRIVEEFPMTAEPRDVEEIRADRARYDGIMDPACTDRLIADVEPLLDRLAAADRENAELRGEVERLRDLVARQLGDCIGCSPATGPEETCPHDGRTYTEWVDIASMVIGRQHAIEAERDDARAKVRAVELVHVWTNEDGRRFVFVDDLAKALGLPV